MSNTVDNTSQKENNFSKYLTGWDREAKLNPTGAIAEALDNGMVFDMNGNPIKKWDSAKLCERDAFIKDLETGDVYFLGKDDDKLSEPLTEKQVEKYVQPSEIVPWSIAEWLGAIFSFGLWQPERSRLQQQEKKFIVNMMTEKPQAAPKGTVPKGEAPKEEENAPINPAERDYSNVVPEIRERVDGYGQTLHEKLTNFADTNPEYKETAEYIRDTLLKPLHCSSYRNSMHEITLQDAGNMQDKELVELCKYVKENDVQNAIGLHYGIKEVIGMNSLVGPYGQISQRLNGSLPYDDDHRKNELNVSKFVRQLRVMAEKGDMADKQVSADIMEGVVTKDAGKLAKLQSDFKEFCKDPDHFFAGKKQDDKYKALREQVQQKQPQNYNALKENAQQAGKEHQTNQLPGHHG